MNPKSYITFGTGGTTRENLFYTSANYEYFLRLYAEHLDPVVETYAFCLMPNHFHLLIRTKPVVVSPAGETTKKTNPVSHAFQRLFTAYSQAINIQQSDRVAYS